MSAPLLHGTSLQGVTGQGTWFGHPKGVFLVAFTELWERFSYFGMTGLLALYLTADTASGGWGWSSGDAVLFYGIYTGLVFVVPVLGAWIANSYLGERRCIVIGAILMMTGHLLLSGPTLLVSVIEHFTHIDAEAVITQSGVALGRIWALPDVGRALAKTAAQSSDTAADALRLYRAAIWTYVAGGGSFLLGLACIVAATGLFKSTITSIVGKMYPESDARRDAGYAVLLTCVYVGAVLANLTAGGLGEKFGWPYGFGAAAVGMAIALVVYLWKEKQYLGDIGVVPDRTTASMANESSGANIREERSRLWVLILQGIFTTIYAAAFYQKGGLLTLYTRDYVDRALFGFQVPATWFMSISVLVFMIATPLLAVAYLRLARQNRNPSASYKLAAGLIAIGAAYALVAAAEATREATDGIAVSGLWLIGMYVLFGISDALVWPNQLALATKLSPKRFAALTVGAWHFVIGIGTFLAALIATIAGYFGILEVFHVLAALCLAAGALVALMTPMMRRWMHGAENTTLSSRR